MLIKYKINITPKIVLFYYNQDKAMGGTLRGLSAGYENYAAAQTDRRNAIRSGDLTLTRFTHWKTWEITRQSARELDDENIVIDQGTDEYYRRIGYASAMAIAGGDDPIKPKAQGGGGTSDQVTNKRIAELDPRLQCDATDFINAAKFLGVELRITQGYRSIEEQNSLYAKGRTSPGQKVTNAKGGQSYHNYRLAFDVVIMKNGKAVWENIPSNIGNLGAVYGFEWGGNWSTFKDYPHFQNTFGQSISQLQKP